MRYEIYPRITRKRHETRRLFRVLASRDSWMNSSFVLRRTDVIFSNVTGANQVEDFRATMRQSGNKLIRLERFARPRVALSCGAKVCIYLPR